MKTNISKTQLEVWDVKESLHNEIKDMSIENGIEYLLHKASETRKRLETSGELKVKQSTNA